MSEGGFFGSFGEGEVPPEIQELLQGLTRRMYDSGLAHDPAERFMPSADQRAVVPGDLVAVTTSQEGDEFTIAKVLNPEDHAEDFPNWEERDLQSLVLAKIYTPSDHSGYLGWLPRPRLVPVTEDQWNQMMRWITRDEWADQTPAWLTRLYNKTLVGLAEANPEDMAMPIRCPECDSPSVIIKLTHHHVNTYAMGNKPGEHEQGVRAKALYVVSPYRQDQKTVTDLICLDCDHTEELPEEQELLRDWRV